MALIELLEIDDSADVQQIREKLRDRHQYFSVLERTAPTPQLKAIYLRKISDLRVLAEKYSVDLSSGTPQGPVPSAGQPATPAPEPAPASQQAFLVLHTEGKALRSFALVPGLNVLGRRQGTTGHTILIDDDYMSKAHAVVDMVSIRDRKALLFDIGELAGNRPSTNGVFLNGNEQRITGKVALHPGDTLQVGYSKLVLTYAEADQQQAATAAVGKTEHSRTVFIKVH